MKKILAIIALGVTLSGCTPSVNHTSDMSTAIGMVPELRACKTYAVYDGYHTMYVVRCPAAETASTATVEKHPVYGAIIVDSNSPSDGCPTQ